jgi:SpoVK/Ycf46/Vps4 family AAA+-type ATPase
VFATLNRIEGLPPELTRRGRFNCIFFVDLPNTRDRYAIWKVHINKKNRNEKLITDEIVGQSDGMSGAEIESIVEDALFEAFSNNRDITSEDLLAAVKNCVPLSKTSAEKMEAIRNWAKGRAISASASDIAQETGRFSNLGV